MGTVIHHPVTHEVDYTDEERSFFQAMDLYMTANHRRFPTFREVLAVVKSLGWRLVAPATDLPRFVTRNSGERFQRG